MTNKGAPASKLEKVLAEQREYNSRREKGYREQAIKLYPWICGRCAREFTRKNLSQLTVHHIDHDHDNNPSDGSNWELLCLYCHDEEHSKYINQASYSTASQEKIGAATFKPFENLKLKIDSM